MTKQGQHQDEIITVLPGDNLNHVITEPSNNTHKKKQIKLGDGLTFHPHNKCITATLAGRLHTRTSSNTLTYYVLHNSKRYKPALHDRVIVMVEERAGSDFYRVSLTHSTTGTALLGITDFDGATKRNRPMLSRGDLLYARVTSTSSQMQVMEPIVSCAALSGEDNYGGGASKKDWMTEEGTYGQLKGGCTASISLGLARELLHPANVVLDALSREALKFEICIGVNGMIWVKSEEDSPEVTVLVMNAIQNSQVMTEVQTRGMVKALVKTIKDNYCAVDKRT